MTALRPWRHGALGRLLPVNAHMRARIHKGEQQFDAPKRHGAMVDGLAGCGDHLHDLADRIRRLAPSHRDPEAFHELKSSIEHELRALAERSNR